MDYIQILVVHSRGVYNFMGIILEAQVSFIFSALCILFNISFRFWPFSNPTVVEETFIEKALNANECVRRIEALIALIMGLTVNAGISIWNEECSAFPHYKKKKERHLCL